MSLLRSMLACLWLALPLSAAGSDAEVAALLAAGQTAEAAHDPETALAHFRAADALRPDDPAILQAIAKQLSDATFVDTNETRKAALVEEALGYAQRAVTLAPDDAVNVLSPAVLYGKLGIYADTSHKVEYARLIRIV